MAQLVLFGAGDIADVAWFYFTHDSPHDVVAFTVDREYLTQDEFHGLPVIPFDECVDRYPPDAFDMFVALSYVKRNRVRAEKCGATKAAGYTLVSYVSSKATTWPDLTVGENCFILEDNTVQPFVTIGDDVTLWCGNHIGHHTTIGDHCFVTSHVVVSGGVVIGEHCFIGVNVTLRDHITLGGFNIIGAGALILGDTEDNAVYPATATAIAPPRPAS